MSDVPIDATNNRVIKRAERRNRWERQIGFSALLECPFECEEDGQHEVRHTHGSFRSHNEGERKRCIGQMIPHEPISICFYLLISGGIQR